MASKKDRGENGDKKKKSLKSETVQGVISVACFATGLFLTLAAFRYAGVAGDMTYRWLAVALGVGYFMLPLILFLFSIATLKAIHNEFSIIRMIASILFFFSGLGIVEIIVAGQGGLVGKAVAMPFLKLFGSVAGILLLVALVVICILVIFDTGINLSPLLAMLKGFFSKRKNGVVVKNSTNTGKEDDDAEYEEDEPEVELGTEEREIKINSGTLGKKINPIGTEEFAVSQQKFRFTNTAFIPIPLSLLEKDRGTPGVGDIKANVNIIKRALQNFDIDVEMDEVTIGPTVTRYALKPAEGVKLSRIVGLQNDLSLALAAHPLRIEAPIPGKSLVGIEVPNTTKSTVGLATMFSDDAFKGSEKPLLVAVGKAISGQPFFGNIGKMPHLLIAGATGAGKSVTIHGLITSLLYRNSPEQLKLIMVDPKRVELTMYNKIPHLLTPVITDAKKSILALKWAAKEMDRRYDILEAESVRDIESYHKNVLMPALKKLEGKAPSTDADSPKIPAAMPYIIIVIDELADIMSTYPRELEAAVVRIAQMSRAVGIHLILSTQRPSVNIITGLIKANIPARIALQVSSQIDSRTILDTGGAEKLLGAGDLLYLSGDMSKPLRLQAPFISETEVKKVVKFLIDAYKDMLNDEINLAAPTGNNLVGVNLDDEAALEDEDELYETAREEVLRAGKASTSYLQRKLSVGYSRAARLIDLLEERGVIGAGHGAKPREVVGGTPVQESSEENPS